MTTHSRLELFAKLMILEAVNDECAWRLFDQSVEIAQQALAARPQLSLVDDCGDVRGE